MTEVLTSTQQVVAERIFNYYLQIIAIKKQQGAKTFVIDRTIQDKVSLVHLQDKYDGKSRWREALGIKDTDDWNTLPGSFRDAFTQGDSFYVNIEDVLNEVSLMLSKQGIANYFAYPSDTQNFYFCRLDSKWLYIVL